MNPLKVAVHIPLTELFPVWGHFRFYQSRSRIKISICFSQLPMTRRHMGRRGHELLAKTVKRLIYYLLAVTSPSGQGTCSTRGGRTQSINYAASSMWRKQIKSENIGNGIGNLGHLTTWRTWQAAMEMRLIGCVKNSGCCHKVTACHTASGDFPFQTNWLVLELIFLFRGLKTAAPHIIWIGGGEKVFWGSNKGNICCGQGRRQQVGGVAYVSRMANGVKTETEKETRSEGGCRWQLA